MATLIPSPESIQTPPQTVWILVAIISKRIIGVYSTKEKAKVAEVEDRRQPMTVDSYAIQKFELDRLRCE